MRSDGGTAGLAVGAAALVVALAVAGFFAYRASSTTLHTVPIASTGPGTSSGGTPPGLRPVSPDGPDALGPHGTPVAAPVDPDAVAAPKVYGRISAARSQPVPGATVRIALESGGASLPIATTTTDAEGRYAAHLAPIAELSTEQRAFARLAFEVSARGLRPRIRSVRLRGTAEAEGVWRMDVILSGGAALTGRTVDPTGAGLAGAELRLFAPPTDDSGRGTLIAQARSGAGGWYSLGFVSGGTASLQARHAAHGTAVIDALELEPATTRELPDLVLSGAGALAGTVRHPDGTPARGLHVLALPEDLADVRSAARLANLAATNERGDGLLHGATETDGDGRFRVAGLRPGRYVLRLSDVEETSQPAGRWEPGSEGIELLVATHRLYVAVRSDAGHPLAGAVVSCRPVPSPSGEAGTDAAVSDAGRDALDTAKARGPEAVAVFDVVPGRTYHLATQLDGCAPAEAAVLVGPGSYEQRVTLTLGPHGRTGRLGVVVTDANGARLRNARVALVTPITRTRGHRRQLLTPDAEGWLPPVPAGRYLLSVRVPPEDDGLPMHFPLDAAREVEIEAGVDRWVEVEALLGGRISLALAVASKPPGFDLAVPADASPEVHRERLRERWGATVSADDGREVRPLSFVVRGAAGSRVDRLLLPDATAGLGDPLLPPGPHTIRITAPGFRPVERIVQVQPGRVTDVWIDLDAE